MLHSSVRAASRMGAASDMVALDKSTDGPASAAIRPTQPSLRGVACRSPNRPASLPAPVPEVTIMLQRLATASALIVIVVLAGRHAAAAAPSFDCTKAQSWAEKQICGDDKLSALDAWLS